MYNTVEIGPRLDTAAPEFACSDHAQVRRHVDELMGEHGLLLGFIGDIWHPASIRRILWLQRHAQTFLHGGINVALLIRDQPYMLYGFYVSSPTPVAFPLLADVRGDVHRLFNMESHPGMVLLDRFRFVRHKWLMPDERVWPKIHELLEMIEQL